MGKANVEGVGELGRRHGRVHMLRWASRTTCRMEIEQLGYWTRPASSSSIKTQFPVPEQVPHLCASIFDSHTVYLNRDSVRVKCTHIETLRPPPGEELVLTETTAAGYASRISLWPCASLGPVP